MNIVGGILIKYNICTIIAKNYVSFARTLSQSFLNLHPNGKCYVLIIDEFDDYIDVSHENFEIIRPVDLNIPRLLEFCFKYNITELSTAFKPFLLSYLFKSNDIDKIIYLDPDILITHSLNNLYDELEITDIILTPHLDTDYPDDGLLPDDSHIMRSGIYNLGIIGLRKCENVDNFLKWWRHKLYDKCVINHKIGYFVDQKFIDLAIVLFPNITPINDKGYNVAYWNIHSRKIHMNENVWMCNDGVLYFYHFSNFKPENPNQISGHQNRFRLQDLPGLHDLFLMYRDLLYQNGYDTTKHWLYSYNYYNNGKAISDIDRIVYRKMVCNNVIVNPFSLNNHTLRLRINIFKSKIIQKMISLLRVFNKYF